MTPAVTSAAVEAAEAMAIREPVTYAKARRLRRPRLRLGRPSQSATATSAVASLTGARRPLPLEGAPGARKTNGYGGRGLRR